MKTNAIARRLQQLSDQWQAFADSADARILCWLFAPDEVAMFDALIEVESDEASAEHPDLFVTLETPFVDALSHGFTLGQTLEAGLRDGQAELRELRLKDGFAAPTKLRDERDIAHLIRTCQALRAYYELGAALVLVLRPSSVADPTAYQRWLAGLALEAPSPLRAVVLDDAQNPSYLQLCAADRKRVLSVRAALDMPAALQELSNAAGNLDTPGGQFRDLFVRLGNALGKQDLPGALALGETALELCRAHGLWHLSVPVHFALAAGLLAAARAPQAIEHYVAAETAAQEGAEQGAEETRAVCAVLRVQARLGHAAALIGSHAFADAAKLYETTAPLARDAADLRSALDCYRLASFCSEQTQQYAQAWQLGLQGVELARGMDRETLESSSLAYLGESMLRLTEHEPNMAFKHSIAQQFSQLFGKSDWRPPKAAKTGP
jgi:hypothetical protein